ncbi:MAG: FHA domain-containing protein [Planctomycetaceae bacterium]|nr:FHA domain-containing protein [Planctomycetaceae bacterium]
MDVNLKVLEGAKVGAKIAIKKPEFTIGRSQACSLCAGSSAVSRQHCMISRDESKVTIRDMGSRNGTLVNGNKIEGTVELASGDEIIVGPLKFLLTITSSLNSVKKPEVKSVAEAVVRTATTPSDSIGDDDISKWLLGPNSALNETQTIRIDDTNAIQKMHAAAAEAASAEVQAAEAAESEKPTDHSGKPAKPEPGKLPKVADKSGTKDSREAAVEALRAWSRRR